MTQPLQQVPKGPPKLVGLAGSSEPLARTSALMSFGVNSPSRLTHRVLRFGVVGVSCYLTQLGLLGAFQLIAHLYLAEIAAFLVSAQLNFMLSCTLTWGDRRGAERLGWQWLKFNANALLSVTLVNAGVFWALVHVGVSLWLAMLFANSFSACCTFALNHLIVFKRKCPSPATISGDN